MLHPKLKKLDLRTAAALPGVAPAWAAQLEEVAAAAPGDWGAALGFGLSRLAARSEPDPRPLALVMLKTWMRERGRPYGRGLAQLRAHPLLITVEREAQAVWALEEALKSGAVSGALATVEAPAFVATRRLDFAARAGGAMGILLRARPEQDLSAARLRWQVGALVSRRDDLDPRAPGPLRWRAELTRRRDAAPGAFTVEWEEGDATPRLRLADRLAGAGLVAAGRTHAAA